MTGLKVPEATVVGEAVTGLLVGKQVGRTDGTVVGILLGVVLEGMALV